VWHALGQSTGCVVGGAGICVLFEHGVTRFRDLSDDANVPVLPGSPDDNGLITMQGVGVV
jgi:hypothetical protein